MMPRSCAASSAWAICLKIGSVSLGGIGSAVDPLRQRLAGHELHLEERRIAHFLEPVERGDVGVIQRGQHSCLALEPALVFRIVRRQLVQDLDGDLAAQPDVLGAIHLAHASGAEGSENPVRADGAAWGETQRVALPRIIPGRSAMPCSCYSDRRMPIRLRVPSSGLPFRGAKARAGAGPDACVRARPALLALCLWLCVQMSSGILAFQAVPPPRPAAPAPPQTPPPPQTPLETAVRDALQQVLHGAREPRRRAGQEDQPVGRQRASQGRLSRHARAESHDRQHQSTIRRRVRPRA